MRQTSSAGRRPPLRSSSSASKQQHSLAARPELSPPPLSTVAVGAAAAAMHRQAISASTSLQVTSRGADEMHQSNENSYHFGGGALETESEALRLNRLLSGSEVAALSDVFYRSFGAHVTPSTLPSFLTAVGIQHDVHQQQQQQQQQHQQSSGGHNKPGDDGNLFEFLRDIILKGVDLEVAFRQAKSTAPTPNSGAALHQGHNKSDSVGHGAVLHRALVKVLSARRLSTAAAAVGGPNTAGGGRLLSARGSLLNTPKTGHLLLPRGGHQHHHHQHLDGSAGGLSLLPPPRALPPTISLDLLCWIARILKDQAIARATASSASAGSNPELLEAYRSCADDVTGTVTVQSVKDRCTLFDVQLSFGSKAEAKKKKWKRQQTALLSAQQQRRNDASANDLPDDDDSDTPMPEYDEDEDDDDDDADAASKANNVELNPVQFAKLLHTRQHQQKSSTAHQGTGDNASPKKKSPPSPTTSSSSSSSSRESSLSMEGNTTFPTPHSASIAQSPLNATTGRQHRLQQLLNSSPNQARGTAQPGGTQQRYLSPKRFVAVPYTEEELQLFEDGSGALQQAPHDQTVLANTLLGTETCVRPSALLQSGGLRCHSAPLSGGASSIAFKRTQQLSGVVNSVTSLLGAHQRNSAASAVQPTMLPQQDVTDQSDVASLLAGGGSTIGGADVADNSSYYHQRSMMSPPSETGVLPPPPSLMATYFLAHQSREARASGTERLSSRENELAVHHRRAVGNDGRWPQDTIGKQPQPPGGAQGVAHMSLGTMNNFDWWPNGSGLPAAASQQRPTAGAGSPQQPLLGRAVHQDHVDQMIEAQDIATKLHPARAALLGQYYHDIAKEKLAATHALASEYHHQHSNVVDHRTSRQLGTGDIVTPHLHHSHHSPPSVPSMLASLNVGQRLDAEFPLRGLTWSSHASGHHHDNLTHHHRESGADFQELNGGGDVLARLTKHHCEQPAISLYRLQQQLTLLESSKQSFEEHVQKQRNKNKSEQSLLLTSTQRLHRFRNAASATTQQTSLHVKDSARPNSLADRNKGIHKVTQRPASAQY